MTGCHGARIVAVLDRDLELERLRFLVEQRDAEDAVIDDALDQVREPGQQLVGIENRAHLAADLRQRFERLGVLALRLEQPRRRDRLRDVRAKLPQDPLVAFGERAELVAQQVERADHLALVAQRHRRAATSRRARPPGSADRRRRRSSRIGRCSATAVPTVP